MGQLVSQDIPNLVGGVSQQSPTLRLPTQASEQINCWNSVIEGLMPRQPTKREAPVDITGSDAYIMDYRRDNIEHYRVVIADDGDKNLRVFDSKLGYEYPVDFLDDVLETRIVREGRVTTTFKDVPYLRPQDSRGFENSFQLLPIFDSMLLVNKSFPTKRLFGVNTEVPEAQEADTRFRIALRQLPWKTYTTKETQLSSSLDWSNPLFCGYGYQVNGTQFVFKYNMTPRQVAAELAKNIKALNPTYTVKASESYIYVTVPIGQTFRFKDISKVSVDYTYTWQPGRDVAPKVRTVQDSWNVNTSTLTAEPVTVTQASTGRPAFEALVWVKRADYATNYIVTVNGSDYTYKTPEATTERARDGLRTEAITSELSTALSAITGLSVTTEGNVVHISSNADFSISAADSLGNTALVALKRNVKEEADLPSTNVPNGYVVKVRGALDDSDTDGYWLKFDRGDAGQGVWVETVGLGLDNGFDLKSMPMLLIRKQDLSRVTTENPLGVYFELGTAPWEPRAVGDEDSASFPSFMSDQDETTGEILTPRTITTACVYQNRLMLAHSDTLTISEVDHYFNLFPTTVATSVDSDPMETTVDTNDALSIEHMTPGVSHMLLWSNRKQYVLANDQVFAAGRVSSRMVAAEEADLSVAPVAIGNRVLFIAQRGKFQALREMYMEEGSDNFAVLDVSAQVPEYIEGKVRKIIGNTSNNAVFLLTTNQRSGPASDTVYVYNYFDEGKERVQSAWSKWQLGADILDMSLDNTTLRLLVARPTAVDADGFATATQTYIETIELAYDVLEQYHGHRLYLDSYEHQATAWAPEDLLPNEITKKVGDRYYKGYLVEVMYEFSPFFLRDEQMKARADGRLQLRRLFLTYSKTTNFVIEVETMGREYRELTFQGRVLGRLDNLIGKVPVTAGRFSAPIMGQSGAVKVRIKNKEIFGFTFQSAYWEGFYHTRNRRV